MKRHSLRIGGGKYRRTQIPHAKSFKGHRNSTTARVKEAAFQIVRNHVDIESDWAFYDLFAGSGQMGIEALSLGASQVTFADIVPERLSEIQQALQQLEIPRNAYTIIRARANKVLSEVLMQDASQCIVWADPPYHYGNTPTNDPAILINLYYAAQAQSTHLLPVLVIQVHEKNPVLLQEFLDAHKEIGVYRYGSNCLLVLTPQGLEQ